MASFERTKSGWRVHLERRGVRKSKTFPTKAQAAHWAASEEAKILNREAGALPNFTLLEAFDRYETEVSRKKRGGRFEALRFAAWSRDFPDLCGKVIHEIRPEDLARWRDQRRESVSDSSVVREANLLRNVFSVAAKEWGWLPLPGPWPRVKLPKEAPPRTRQTESQELKRLVRHMGFVTGKPPTTPMQEVAWAFLIAHHTGMRAGEVLSLTTRTVDLEKRVAKLESHKTIEREGIRFVPFTRKAARLLKILDEQARTNDRLQYFKISSQSLDVLFRKVRDRLLITNLRFHDSRAAALTRLARRMDVMTLSKISGHRDLNQLLRAYYRESPEQIAARI